MQLVQAAGPVEGVGRDRVGHFVAVQVGESGGLVGPIAPVLVTRGGPAGRERLGPRDDGRGGKTIVGWRRCLSWGVKNAPATKTATATPHGQRWTTFTDSLGFRQIATNLPARTIAC